MNASLAVEIQPGTAQGIQRFHNRPIGFRAAPHAGDARELQDKLFGLFFGMSSMGMNSVVRAYLTEAEYENSDQHQLAVCLVADRRDAEKLAGAVAKVFERIYKEGRLDILFISEEQERLVSAISEPFYSN